LHIVVLDKDGAVQPGRGTGDRVKVEAWIGVNRIVGSSGN
jgi:hypothetical protein